MPVITDNNGNKMNCSRSGWKTHYMLHDQKDQLY